MKTLTLSELESLLENGDWKVETEFEEPTKNEWDRELENGEFEEAIKVCHDATKTYTNDDIVIKRISYCEYFDGDKSSWDSGDDEVTPWVINFKVVNGDGSEVRRMDWEDLLMGHLEKIDYSEIYKSIGK